MTKQDLVEEFNKSGDSFSKIATLGYQFAFASFLQEKCIQIENSRQVALNQIESLKLQIKA